MDQDGGRASAYRFDPGCCAFSACLLCEHSVEDRAQRQGPAALRLDEHPPQRRRHGPLQTLANNLDALIRSPRDVADARRLAIDLAVRRRLVPRRGPRTIRRLGSLVEVQNGYAFESSWYVAHGVRLVRNQNVGHGTLDWRDERRISEARAGTFDRFRLKEGDIVLSLDRPLISTGLKVARVREQDLPALLLQRVARPQYVSDDLNPDFPFMWLQSSAFIDHIAPGRSNGVPHISSRQVEELQIDLPPLEEQHQIVERASALLGIIESLFEAIAKASGIHAAFGLAALQRWR